MKSGKSGFLDVFFVVLLIAFTGGWLFGGISILVTSGEKITGILIIVIGLFLTVAFGAFFGSYLSLLQDVKSMNEKLYEIESLFAEQFKGRTARRDDSKRTGKTDKPSVGGSKENSAFYLKELFEQDVLTEEEYADLCRRATSKDIWERGEETTNYLLYQKSLLDSGAITVREFDEEKKRRLNL